MQDAADKATLIPDSRVWGVFGYIEATLPPAQRQMAGNGSQGVGRSTMDQSSVRQSIAKEINRVFRLQYWGCPLRDELEGFRLYHNNDMADALAAAYCLHKAGESPLPALMADYAVNWGGVLSWVDLDEYKRGSKESRIGHNWNEFQPFFRNGDRFVHYSLPTLTGTMLVRGDRLVWEKQALQMCVPNGNPQWDASFQAFKERGSYKAFFAENLSMLLGR